MKSKQNSDFPPNTRFSSGERSLPAVPAHQHDSLARDPLAALCSPYYTEGIALGWITCELFLPGFPGFRGAVASLVFTLILLD